MFFGFLELMFVFSSCFCFCLVFLELFCFLEVFFDFLEFLFFWAFLEVCHLFLFVFVSVFGVFYVYDGSSSVLGCCVWFIQLHFSREQRRRFLMS